MRADGKFVAQTLRLKRREKKKTLVDISSGDDNLYEVLFKRSTRKGGDHRARVQARVNIDRDGVYNVITLL